MIDWNVKNAVNPNVERQHLNKILKEIRGTYSDIDSRLNAATEGLGNVQNGLTTTITKVINNTLPAGDLATQVELTGDVVGTSVKVPGQNAVTINTSLSQQYVTEAPIDANPYWRFQGQWQAVPPVIANLGTLPGNGYLVISDTGVFLNRSIVSADTDNIVVLNGDGNDDNTSIDLALVPDGGVAPTLLKVTRDAYGRVDNTQAATASDVPVAKLGSATWDNVQEYINVMNSPGLVEGGGFTDAGSGNLAYAAMRIAIRPTDNDTSTLFMADIAAGSVAIPNDSITRFIGVQYNAGVPNVVVKTANTWDYDTDFPLGEVANLGGTLFPLFNPFKVGDPITNIIQRFDAQAPLIRSAEGGLALSTDGTTRNLAMTAGTVWARLNDYSIAARDSTVVPMLRVNPTGGTPPLSFTPGITQWPNTEYLVGNTLTTLGNNRWAVLWVFVNVGTGAWGFAHGQAEYLNSSAAAQEQVPSYLTQNFLQQNILVGRLIFEKNATTAIIESAFTRVFSTQPVSDHNQLSGLQGGALGEYYHLTAAQLADAGTALQPGDNVSELVNDAGYAELAANSIFTGANQFDQGIGIGVAPNAIDGVFVIMNVNADAGDPTGIYTDMTAGSLGPLPASRNLYGMYGGATSAITYANSGGLGVPVFPVTSGLRAEGYSADTAATDWSYITNGVDAIAVNGSSAAAVGSVNALKGDASDTAGAVGGLSMTGISGSITQTSTTAVYNNLFGIDASVSSAGPVVDSYAIRVTCFANALQTGTRYGLSITGVEQNYIQGYTLFDDFTSSVSPTTGAIVTSGGLGVGGNVNIGFNLSAGGEGRFGNYVIPNAHNAYSLGLSFLAWTEVFAQNPVISPSDARMKTGLRDMSASEIAAFSAIARLPNVWQWIHRVDDEGNDARLHSGPTVQAAMAIMSANGLEPFDYAAFCYDEWEDQYDDAGNIAALAGDRFSFRREELLSMIVRAMAAQYDALEARVSALENR